MFPGAEPYVSLVENVGFCGEKHKSCGTVARLFPVRFSIRKERGKGLCLWRQKKAVWRCFWDGEFAFSLDEDTFAAAALHQDDELEDWQIEELRKKSETRRALDKAMDYLSLRDHAAGGAVPEALPEVRRPQRCLRCGAGGELGL